MTDFNATMRDFWKESHAVGGVDRLTDTSLTGHLSYLKATLPEKGAVLCVGVGTGNWVRSLLSETQLSVSALDIVSPLGLGVQVFTSPSQLPIDYFDLALSLWISPHMDDAGLSSQVWYVIRSLKKGGLFAIHYNEPLNPSLPLPEQTVGAARAGSMLRRREEFLDMVAFGEGRAEIVRVDPKPVYQMQMVVAHVRRN